MTPEFEPVFVRELTIGFRNCVVVNSQIDCEYPDRRQLVTWTEPPGHKFGAKTVCDLFVDRHA
jgi:hypothetical protein